MLHFMPTHASNTDLPTEPGLRDPAQRGILPREDWLLGRAAARPRSGHDPAAGYDRGLAVSEQRARGSDGGRQFDLGNSGRVFEHATIWRNTLMPVSVSTPIAYCAAARYGPSGVLWGEPAFGLSVGEETSPLVWSTKKISSARQTGIPMSRANVTRKRTRIGASR